MADLETTPSGREMIQIEGREFEAWRPDWLQPNSSRRASRLKRLHQHLPAFFSSIEFCKAAVAVVHSLGHSWASDEVTKGVQKYFRNQRVNRTMNQPGGENWGQGRRQKESRLLLQRKKNVSVRHGESFGC